MGNGSREKRLGVPGSSDGGWRLAKMEFAETLGSVTSGERVMAGKEAKH